MDTKDILKCVDHTLLLQTATWEEIKKICDEGMEYHTASVCIPPFYVSKAKEYVDGKVAVCTVIGFPNGYSTTETKVFEAGQAVKDGADEIDMVINIAMLKNKQFDLIEDEIVKIKKAVGSKILKVIIETCLLTKEEKITMCRIVSNAGADFIKTSTGFSTDGATVEDIKLFKQHVNKDVQIKAAGGIKTLDDAIQFIELGATRLGTSRIIKILQNNNATGY